MNYNYLEAIKRDVRERLSLYDLTMERDDLEAKLNDDLWTEDGVTGNGCGSYTCDRYMAEEYICHNLYLLKQALDEFDIEAWDGEAESADIIIRCYLLPQAISEVLNEVYDE